MCDWWDPFRGVPFTVERDGDDVIVEVVRTVPGLVEGRYLRSGETVELSDPLAVSLMNDGFLKPSERAVEAEASEKAVAAPQRRSRNKT